MELVGTELGRVIILFTPEEGRPTQGIHQKSFVEETVKRYAFSVDGEQIMGAILGRKSVEPGLIFKDGKFSFGKTSAVVQEFAVYSDGISVSAFDTDAARAFVDDLYDWLRAEFGFRGFSRDLTYLYSSQVVVKFSREFSGFTEVFANAARALREGMGDIYSGKIDDPSITRFGIGWDPKAAPDLFGRSEFIIERRLNVPFAEGHFYSRASLPTQAHLKLLQKLEGLWA